MSKKSKIEVGKVNTYIVTWLKEYATNAKANGFVIGISGGIDSAVTSALCAQTGLTTICVEMPIHQDSYQVNRGKEQIEKLKKTYSNVTNIETDLTAVFETFKSAVPSSNDSTKFDLSLANSRARLRMTTLYYHASINGLLVAGTGNKVEDFGVGFYTKYGDGGVDLSPIADLMKSEVYALGEYLQIPQSILNAPPTDGLFGDSRTDEEQLGASYDELEWAMTVKNSNIKSKGFSAREKEVYEIYIKLNTANQHKMNTIPICVIPNK
jgi:NAD+ synthase